jgi:hypothetical protein
MSQRYSEYVRRPNDDYVTPLWVTAVITRYLRNISHVWDPAAGVGKMVRALNHQPAQESTFQS